LWLTAEILVKWWVIFADVLLEICMDLAMSYGTHLWHWLVSVLVTVCQWQQSFPLFFAFIDSCYSLMGGTVKWLIVWEVTAPWEIMLCSWVIRFAEPQCCDAVSNLTICHSHCQIPHSMISIFVVAPRGFSSKAYSKGFP
jgi:hypothetical protein